MLGWLRRLAAPIPFAVEHPATASEAAALFSKSFGTAPPDFPHHFLARHGATGGIAGYIHYTEAFPGVYLCGGLCVDAHAYRQLAPRERDALRRRGSLSRWLLDESIRRLPAKKAVFAYTGNTASRRDGFGVGFVETGHRHLIVQWHAAAEAEKARLVEQVAALGAF